MPTARRTTAPQSKTTQARGKTAAKARTTPGTKPKPKAATPAPRGEAQPTASENVRPDARRMAAIRNHWAVITRVERDAYRSQISDEECEELGTRTKGTKVRNEAAGWMVKMDQVMRSGDAKDLPYSASRMRYFIDLIDALSAELAAQDAQQGKATGTKNALTDAQAEAEEADKNLYDALNSAAGKRPTERRALTDADIAVETPEDRVKRLEGLVALGKQWVADPDPLLQVLVRDSQLTAAIIDGAFKAAAVLSDARTGTRSVRSDPRDTPTVNLAEGRLLYDMKFASQQFDIGHTRNKRIPRLIPGPATRIAITGRSRSTKKTKQDEPSDSTTSTTKNNGTKKR